jgi:hypothetical protein
MGFNNYHFSRILHSCVKRNINRSTYIYILLPITFRDVSNQLFTFYRVESSHWVLRLIPIFVGWKLL